MNSCSTVSLRTNIKEKIYKFLIKHKIILYIFSRKLNFQLYQVHVY